MDAASKAARAEARKKSGNQAPRKDQPDSSPHKAAPAPEIPVPAKSEHPKPASLFDPAPKPAALACQTGRLQQVPKLPVVSRTSIKTRNSCESRMPKMMTTRLHKRCFHRSSGSHRAERQGIRSSGQETLPLIKRHCRGVSQGLQQMRPVSFELCHAPCFHLFRRPWPYKVDGQMRGLG